MKLFRITKTFVRNKMFWKTEVLKILAVLACENWNQFDLCACISILSLINNLRINTLPVTDQIKVLVEHRHSVIQGQFPPCLKEKKSSPPNFSHPWVPRILIPPSPSSEIFLPLLLSKLKNKFWTLWKPTFC